MHHELSAAFYKIIKEQVFDKKAFEDKRFEHEDFSFHFVQSDYEDSVYTYAIDIYQSEKLIGDFHAYFGCDENENLVDCELRTVFNLLESEDDDSG